MLTEAKISRIGLVTLCLILGSGALSFRAFSKTAPPQSLTPLQSEIEKQRARLNSSDMEERRDAAMRLGTLRHPDASRVATIALKDPSSTVRVAAMPSTLWLAPDESAAALIPVLKDKDEFVRQEAAYALGRTHSRSAVAPLIALLGTEKKSGVRGAIVVALGHLGDATAVVPLAVIVAPELTSSGKTKAGKYDNEFVLRAAARSLGQIRNRAGVPALSAVLANEKNPPDLRREAAIALGLIGDPEGEPVLRSVLSAEDPYLSMAANDSLKRIASRKQ
jgi:HEAT repeat protein